MNTLRYLKDRTCWELTYGDDGTVRYIGSESAAIRAAGPEFSYIPEERESVTL